MNDQSSAWRLPRLGGSALILIAACAFLLGSCSREKSVNLNEFEDIQEACCERLRQSLEVASEWRVVLDISESYVGSDGPADVDSAVSSALGLLAQLPVMKGDSICLDSFGASYNTGKCFIVGGEAVLDEALHPWGRFSDGLREVLRSAPAEDRAWTDFEELVDALRAREYSHGHHSNGVRGKRSVYLVVTDGRQDPPEFRDGAEGTNAPRFLDPEDFASLCAMPGGQALHADNLVLATKPRVVFVVDYAALGSEEAEVREFWRDDVDDQLRRWEEDEELRERTCLAAVAHWDSDTQSEQLGSRIQRLTGRAPGAYLCLGFQEHSTLASSESSSLSARTCLPAEKGFVGLRPTNEMLLYGSNQDLMFTYLGIGPWEGRVKLTLKSAHGSSTRKFQELEFDGPVFEGWKLKEVAFPVEFDGDAVNGHRLPLKGRVATLGGIAETDEFEVSIRPVKFWEGLGDLMGQAGVLGMALALLFLLASVAFSYMSSLWPVEVCLGVVKGEREGAPAPGCQGGVRFKKDSVTGFHGQPFASSTLSSGGCRYFLNHDDSGGVDVEDWYHRPPEAPDEAKVESRIAVVDILHLGFMIYFIVWRLRGRRNPRVVKEGRRYNRLTKFNAHKSHLGKLVAEIEMPRTGWMRMAPGRWLERKWGSDWEIESGEPGVRFGLEAWLFENWKSFLTRKFSWLAYVGVFASSFVGVFQLLRWRGEEVCWWATGLWIGGLIVGLTVYSLLDEVMRIKPQWLRPSILIGRTVSILTMVFFVTGLVLLISPNHPANLVLFCVLAGVAAFFVIMFPFWLEHRLERQASMALPRIILDGLPFVTPMVGQA